MPNTLPIFGPRCAGAELTDTQTHIFMSSLIYKSLPFLSSVCIYLSVSIYSTSYEHTSVTVIWSVISKQREKGKKQTEVALAVLAAFSPNERENGSGQFVSRPIHLSQSEFTGLLKNPDTINETGTPFVWQQLYFRGERKCLLSRNLPFSRRLLT